MSSAELLRVEDIHKTFPGVKALKGANLQVLSGEIHALVGENGAGKSTLIKCIMGVHKKDEHKGRIMIEGNEIGIQGPLHAKSLGMGAVYQDVMMAPHLTVAENFFLGNLPSKNGIINWKKAHQDASKLLKELNIQVDTKSKLSDLSIAKQEMVAIAKMVADNSKVVVFDEPTALLSNEETEILFDLIIKLKNKGIGIIYISHRMEEIFRISDRVTILKDGSYVDTLKTSETNEDEIIQKMVGRSVENMYHIEKPKIGNETLQVRGLTKNGVFKDINFDVHRGEIFGMFGLVGSGRTEIVECIFGAEHYDKGTVYIEGEKVDIKSPGQGISAGLGLVTEDRKKTGLFMELACSTNTNIISYKQISKAGVIDGKKEKENSKYYKNTLSIKTPSINQRVKNLSGGNQQKVVLSKWLSNKSKILIIDEPTVGVDVGAKVEIYKLIEGLLKEGISIIMISSYLPEIMGLADRIMVIAEGNQMCIVDKSEFTLGNDEDEEKFVKLASGIKV